MEEAARYQCDVCQLTFQEMERLRDHMVYHLDPPYVCTFDPVNCSKRFPGTDRVREHVYKIHLKWRQYKCIFDESNCKLTFHYLKAAREHILSMHLRASILKCERPRCRFTTNSKRRLKIHYQKHENPKTFPCPAKGCKASFSRNKGRLSHIRTLHPDFDPEEYKKLFNLRRKKVDGVMEVINGEAVVVEEPSYSPFEAEMRRSQVTGIVPRSCSGYSVFVRIGHWNLISIHLN